MIVANCSITKYPAHAALEDPNVDLTDNNLSLAGNGLNVGVSAIRCHRVAIFHLYQFLFTICTDLKQNGCNLLRLLNPARLLAGNSNDHHDYEQVGLWKTVLYNDLELIVKEALKIRTFSFPLSVLA